MSNETPTPEAAAPEQTFTQADVDRIVRERVQRERAKFGDYEDLKAKAGQATTLEQRVAEIEQRASAAELSALRANVASEYGISKEDRDLFLTGADLEALQAQAKRLAERESDQRKKPPVVSKQGTDNTPPKPDDMREFARELFGRRP